MKNLVNSNTGISIAIVISLIGAAVWVTKAFGEVNERVAKQESVTTQIQGDIKDIKDTNREIYNILLNRNVSRIQTQTP